MPIANSDIVLYGSANMQETDAGTPQGGAISTQTVITFNDIITTGVLSITTDTASTGSVVVTGREASGVISTDTYNFSASTTATPTSSIAFERILKIDIADAIVGIITINDAGANLIKTIDTSQFGVGNILIKRPFYDVSSNATGGGVATYYEKIFVQNNNATLSLLGATLAEGAGTYEDVSHQVDFGLESSANDTSTNRLTAPAGVTFASTSVNVGDVGTDLSAGGNTGVWLRLTLSEAATAKKGNYVFDVSGSSV